MKVFTFPLVKKIPFIKIIKNIVFILPICAVWIFILLIMTGSKNIVRHIKSNIIKNGRNMEIGNSNIEGSFPSFKINNCLKSPCLIIHQSYKSYDIPSVDSKFIKSCLKVNSNYEYWFWTDTENRKLIEMYHSDILGVYDNLKNDVGRADIARILYLEVFGGVYIDMDVECHLPFDGLISGANCTFAQEPLKQALAANVPFPLVSNFFMACDKNHPFLAMIIEKLKEINSRKTETKVIFQTGPVAITRLYNQVKEAYPHLIPQIHNHTVFSQSTVFTEKIRKLCLSRKILIKLSKIKNVSIKEVMFECQEHVFKNNYDRRYIYMNHHFTNVWSVLGKHLKNVTVSLQDVVSDYDNKKSKSL